MGIERKVFITRRVPQPGMLLLKKAGLRIESWDSDEAISREELIRGIEGADAVLCMLTDTIDDSVLEAAGWFLLSYDLMNNTDSCR